MKDKIDCIIVSAKQTVNGDHCMLYFINLMLIFDLKINIASTERV